jgi:hypothetical protein
VALGLLLLSFVDVIVLECIYKPLSARHHIPWSEFEVVISSPLGPVRCLWWHVAFVPLGVGIFVLLGAVSRDLRLALAGIALFLTGWEDAIYYALLLQPIPKELPWLDPQIFVSWTRVLTRADHVTRVGLFAAMTVGGIVAGLALRRTSRPERGRSSVETGG